MMIMLLGVLGLSAWILTRIPPDPFKDHYAQ